MLVRLRGSGPLHQRVYGELRRSVLDGRLRPGERLPSTRALARELGVSRTVVVQAYGRLEVEGYVEGRVGSGTFVPEEVRLDGRPAGGASGGCVVPAPAPLSAWGSRALAAGGTRPEPVAGRACRYDFRYGRPVTGIFPFDRWRRLVARVAARPPTDYQDPRGSRALREALARTLARDRAVAVEPDRIVVVTGSQQGLDLAARVLLDPGDGVVVEDPQYQGALHAFRAAGARVLPVPTDADGLVTERLPAGPGPIRLAYVTPSHQFPSGGVMPLARRLELLQWAGRHDALIVEDDYDGEFRYDAPPVEAVQALDEAGRVLYMGTFSKVLFPALRLGYLVLPPALVDAFLSAKWLSDRHSPVLEQEALALFIREGHYRRHARRTGRLLDERRSAFLDALERAFGGRARVEGARSGMHVVLRFPGLEAERVPALVEAARARGVGAYPVAPYHVIPPIDAGLLLGWGALTADELREGVRRLREAVEAVDGNLVR